MTIGTFYKYAFDSDYKKYREIRTKYEKEDKWIGNTEDEIARMFIKYYGDNFVRNDGKIYHYNGCVWLYERDGVSIRNTIRNELVWLYKNKIIKIYSKKDTTTENDSAKVSAINKIIKLCQKQSTIMAISKLIIDSITNENIKWDQKEYLFAFENKIYNLDERTFVKPNKYDYINICTGYKYKKPSEKQVDTIKKILTQIFPLINERIFYLIILVTSLYGVTLEKFVLANGAGRNGKGVLNELQMKVAGNYGYLLPNAVLLGPLENKSGPNPAVAGLHQKRLVISREPDSDKIINTGTVKEITGGADLHARKCNSNNTHVDNKGTNIMECNTRPKLGGDDFATKQRIIDALFRSTFVENPEDEIGEYLFEQNKQFKNQLWQEEHKHALFEILTEIYLPKYLEVEKKIEGLIPDAFKERANTFINDSNSIFNFFQSTHEKTNDKGDVIKLADFYESYKWCDDYITFTAKEKRKYNLGYFREKIQTGTAFRGIYVERLQKGDIKKYNEKNGSNISLLRNVLVGWKPIVAVDVVKK
jgi:phage/plasmid-associated DNA primase